MLFVINEWKILIAMNLNQIEFLLIKDNKNDWSKLCISGMWVIKSMRDFFEMVLVSIFYQFLVKLNPLHIQKCFKKKLFKNV